MIPVDRSVDARVQRHPDLFLCHSTRDKDFVRQLAEDLAFCQVDVWLDEWEIHPGESLENVIQNALGACRYVAVVMGDNFNDSAWASEEVRLGLAREQREDRFVVVPLVVGAIEIPQSIKDKLYVDFRTDYYGGIVRLSGLVNRVPLQHIQESIRATKPRSIRDAIEALRDAGFEPYVIMSKEDGEAIQRAGGTPYLENRLRFSPQAIEANPHVSPRLRRMMKRLSEVW